MITKPRIFISSTYKDLEPEREAVEKALHRMEDTEFVGMEHFGSRPDTTLDTSLAEVGESDIYVGIFAARYGSGITEAEYRRARDLDLDCLIYLKDEQTPLPPEHVEADAEKAGQLQALKQELKAHHTLSWFKSPEDLAWKLEADLHKLLGRQRVEREVEEGMSRPKYNVTIVNSPGANVGDQISATQYFGTAGQSGQQATAPAETGASLSELRRLAQRIEVLVTSVLSAAPVDTRENPLWQLSKWRRVDPGYAPEPQWEHTWRRPLPAELLTAQAEGRTLYIRWWNSARIVVERCLDSELPAFDGLRPGVERYINLEVGAPCSAAGRESLVAEFVDLFSRQRSILEALA